jgi:hypothetical protein
MFQETLSGAAYHEATSVPRETPILAQQRKRRRRITIHKSPHSGIQNDARRIDTPGRKRLKTLFAPLVDDIYNAIRRNIFKQMGAPRRAEHYDVRSSESTNRLNERWINATTYVINYGRTGL